MKTLKDKVAVVFAASGEIAGAVAQSFAEHGAKVYVSARKPDSVKSLAESIKAKGGWAEAAKVDALNETEIDKYFQKIVKDNGRLDMVFNGIGISISDAGSGIPTMQVPFEQFLSTFQTICGSQFLTSRVAARYMVQAKSEGTILLLTASLSKSKIPFMAPITAACTGIEGITRVMAAEFGKQGIKVICLNSSALAETSRMIELRDNYAKMLKLSEEQKAGFFTQNDISKTIPTLRQLGEVAAFLASDHGVAFNSHIVDVDCGKSNVM
jgi:NAD(P)-dependent dehydrogenase (short-subunit alcohol dehydrogenase family)